MEVVNGVEHRWKELGVALCFSYSVRQSEKHKIERLYRIDHQRMEALINHYVRHYPTPSWNRVAFELKNMKLRQLANMVTTKYVRGMWLGVSLVSGGYILMHGPKFPTL